MENIVQVGTFLTGVYALSTDIGILPGDERVDTIKFLAANRVGTTDLKLETLGAGTDCADDICVDGANTDMDSSTVNAKRPESSIAPIVQTTVRGCSLAGTHQFGRGTIIRPCAIP